MRRAIALPELKGRPFTSEDARAVGLTYKQLRSSAYRHLFHDVYVDATEPATVQLRAAAIGLVLPDDAVVGLTAGAWLHGADVRDRRHPEIEVIAQRGDQIRRAGIKATSAMLTPEDVTEVLGVPVTTPTRTAFDLARRRDLVEAVVGIDAMLNRGGANLRELAEYTATHRKWRYVRTVDAALTHAEPLSESPMETRQRMRFVLAGLPRPRAQVPVEGADGVPFAYIDNGYEQFRVGADYDGEDHSARWRYDLERQERVRDEGWWHRRYTSLHIQAGWRQMVSQVGRALVAAGWRP
jgi:very-short-patch-repair endonuclease